MNDPICIIGITRTPTGNLLGMLKHVTAPELGAAAIKGVLEKTNLKPDQIDEVIMGCVLPAGLGQAPARQAAIGAGIPVSTGATTINKMCGSGMKATLLAHDLITAGPNQIMIAGGMESMSNAPYLIKKARAGYKFGHDVLYDHMLLDGLEDAYDKGKPMGYFAEICAEKYKFSREMQDEFAIASLTRAQLACDDGSFISEITPIKVKHGKEELLLSVDEGPQKAKVEKIPQLKPAFKENGTVTAANSSSISDGAAALILTKLSVAKKLGVKPLAVIKAHATHSQEPAWFTTAPVGAIEKVLAKTGWSVEDVDLFEINEAFAVVTMVAMHDLNIPHEKVNVHGGACTLGHPIGASGARILVTLIAALEKYKLKRGVAALCIGGGEATAVAVEIL